MKHDIIGFLVILILTVTAGAQQNGIESVESPVTDSTEPTYGTSEIEIEIESDAEDASADTTRNENNVTSDSLPPLESMPEITEFAEADYPDSLQKDGVEGLVRMDLLVSDSGTVDSVAVVKGLHPVLDSSAVLAARRFQFSPATAGGEPVPVILQYEYRFSLQEAVERIDEYVNFSGRLLEKGTRKPIIDAMVVVHFIDTASDTTLPVPFGVYRDGLGRFEGQYLEENRLVTLTDSTGRFAFTSLPAVSVEVTAPIPGYEAFAEKERLMPGELLEVTYYIERVSYNELEITVYGQVEEKEVSRRQLNVSEVKKIPGLGGDAIRVVQALPGVSRPSFGGGQIVVRGAPTWDSKFYLDGVLLPQLYHFSAVKSVYNSDALETIDFYPGGWSSRYGGAIAGAVEVTGKKAADDRWQGYLDPNINDGTFFVEGPVNDRVSVLTAGRMNFSGFLLKWGLDNLDFNLPFTMQPFYWDYLARADVKFTEESSGFLTLFGSGDRIELLYKGFPGGNDEIDEATDRAEMSLAWNMVLAGWDRAVTERLTNALRLSVTRANSLTSIFGTMKVDNIETFMHLRDELSYDLTDNMRINLGADVFVDNIDMNLTLPGTSDIPVRDTITDWLFGDIGGYLMVEWQPIEEVQIIPGLRYDLYTELDYRGAKVPEFWDYTFDNTTSYSGEPSLRVNGRYNFLDNHTFKGAVGSYSQSPQPAGFVIHDEFGDPHLPATKASHYVLGYEWQITDLISLDVLGYYNRQWNIPRMGFRGADVAGGAATWIPDEKGRMGGMELMLRHDSGDRFFGWLAYTLSRSERYDSGLDEWVLFTDDETHNLQVLGSWRLDNNWDVGFRGRYVTGKPSTPIERVTYDEDQRMYVAEEGEPYSERMDPFFQLDIRVDKKVAFNKYMLSLYADLQNISYFFYKSPEFYVYDDFYDMETRQTVSSIFIPAIGVRFEF